MQKGAMSLVGNVLVAVSLAAAAGCGPPSCPRGYDQKGDTCYRHKDAGTSDADAAMEDSAIGRVDSEVPERDAAAGSSEHVVGDDAAEPEAGSVSMSGPPSCSLKCGEHEVCQVVDGSETCACARGYGACGADAVCTDTVSDPQNCGACGYACAEGLSCKQGDCEQRIRELVLDEFVSCALYDSPDGNYPLKCWGDTRFGLFRDGLTDALTPRQVAGVPRVRAIAVPHGRYCGVLPGEDTVRCWGDCGLECGNPSGSRTTGSTFSRDVLFTGVTRISGAGGDQNDRNTCALAGSGRVSCWGTSYLIASPDSTNAPVPVLIDGIATFVHIDAGASHTCAITADGRIGCWGWRTGDALGIAEESVSSDPSLSGVFVPKESGGDLDAATQVAAGVNSCAVTRDSELWCWGSNDGRGSTAGPGLLGIGDTARHVGAVRVKLSNVVAVDVGWCGHACAIAQGGQVYCWGEIQSVGLGPAAVGDVGDGRIFSSPQAVPGLPDAVEIRAGAYHSCARRRNGQVLCWGANGWGQIGDGTKVQRFSPTPVLGLY